MFSYWHLWLLARRMPSFRHVSYRRSALGPAGGLVTFSRPPADPGLCVVNTHPVANWDGNWSRASRFYPLHRAQLAALARMVRGIGVPAVVGGDFCRFSSDLALSGDR